jgi:site-specific DNA recombinase
VDPAQDWVISTRPAHPALVSEGDFVAVQAVRAARLPEDGTARIYRLAGLLTCGICGRRMDSHWVNDRPGYRCRHGHTSATTLVRPQERERSVYVREDELLHDLASTLRQDDAGPDLAEIPELLRAQKITITCGHSHRTLTRDQPEPAR